MSNESEAFCESLFAAFERFRITDATRLLYRTRIGAWRLRPEQWRTAFDALIAEYKDTELPAVGTIFDYLRTASGAQADRRSWLWFTDPEGIRRVIIVKDPMRLPKLPDGATDIRFQPAPGLRARVEADPAVRRDVEGLVRQTSAQLKGGNDND